MYMYIVPHLPLLRPHIWQVVAPGTRSRSGWLGGSGETRIQHKTARGEVVTKKNESNKKGIHHGCAHEADRWG